MVATARRGGTTSAARLRIGVAGWSLPAGSGDQFAAGAHQLQRYASRLDAVEINSSFYRSHARSTYAGWASLVPREFRFAVKVPRSITQYARLRDVEALLDAFMEEVGGLGRRLGRLLCNAPSLAFDARWPIGSSPDCGPRGCAHRDRLRTTPRKLGDAEAAALWLKHRVARVPPISTLSRQPAAGWPGTALRSLARVSAHLLRRLFRCATGGACAAGGRQARRLGHLRQHRPRPRHRERAGIAVHAVAPEWWQGCPLIALYAVATGAKKAEG